MVKVKIGIMGTNKIDIKVKPMAKLMVEVEIWIKVKIMVKIKIDITIKQGGLDGK